MRGEFQTSLFIFRRDLRLHDNTALIKSLEKSEIVIPAFIFDPYLINKSDRNPNAIQFMMESLSELDNQLKSYGSQLYYFNGTTTEVVNQLIQSNQIEAIFSNFDYSPYARKRREKINKICKQNNVKHLQYSDYVLVNPESIYTQSGERYQVFTYFYKKASSQEILPPVDNTWKNYFSNDISESKHRYYEKYLPDSNSDLYVNGGRSNALKIIKNIDHLKNYDELKDYPFREDGTTHLSAHIKFGTISIREVYHKMKSLFGIDHGLIRQLFWREFYIYLAVHYTHVFEHSFRKKYDRLTWVEDEEKFKKWCQGETGFPIVDAGMRQLNKTGYMHNRVRMIVASFLVKDLHINWRKGESYFAKHLVDYDLIVNNGNWQWAASTGADAQPYFRIFNPWSQQKKYDKNAEYIKKYIPELRTLTPNVIHNLHSQRPLDTCDYPEPIVNHKKRAKQAKEMFKSVN